MTYATEQSYRQKFSSEIQDPYFFKLVADYYINYLKVKELLPRMAVTDTEWYMTKVGGNYHKILSQPEMTRLSQEEFTKALALYEQYFEYAQLPAEALRIILCYVGQVMGVHWHQDL